MVIQQHNLSKQSAVEFSNQVVLRQTQQHLHIEFAQPYWVLSSAVENGGLIQAQHLLNLKVDGDVAVNESPQQSLQHYAQQQAWQGTLVAMMTAASMDSCRLLSVSHQGVELAVALTLGLSNAGRVGEAAGYRQMRVTEQAPGTNKVGTINIVLLCSAPLSPSAMVEAVQMVTEAKVAALQNYGITSVQSSQLATGTGTDAVAVCCALAENAEPTIQYCGKHLLIGELIGRLVQEAMLASLAWYRPGHQGNKN